MLKYSKVKELESEIMTSTFMTNLYNQIKLFLKLSKRKDAKSYYLNQK